MAFREKLKKSSPNVAESSIKTYLFNIKRLAKLTGRESTPEKGSRWLFGKRLFKAVEEMPLNARKMLSSAAVKAARAYGVKPRKWLDLMNLSSKQYSENRDKRVKSKREEMLWPKDGYKSILGAAKTLEKKLPIKKLEEYNFADLRKLQAVWLLYFYGTHAPRLIETVRIDGKGPNTLTKGRSGFLLVLKDYKTAKTRGATRIKLDKSISKITSDFLKVVRRLTDHGYLLSNARNAKISKVGLSTLLRRTTAKAGLKGISVQLIRVLKSTANRNIIEKARALEQEMGHGSKQSLQYSKK